MMPRPRKPSFNNSPIETMTDVSAAQVFYCEDRNGSIVGARVGQRFLRNTSKRHTQRYSDLSEGYGNWDRHQVMTAFHNATEVSADSSWQRSMPTRMLVNLLALVKVSS